MYLTPTHKYAYAHSFFRPPWKFMTDRHREQMSNTLIGDDCIMGTGKCSISGTRFNLGNTSYFGNSD